MLEQETQISLANCATRLEVSQGHQTWYHSTCYVRFNITVLLLLLLLLLSPFVHKVQTLKNN